MIKLTVTLLTFVLFVQSASAVSAKPKGDWNMVKVLVNHSIAVKTRNGETHYGLLQFADDNEIHIQIAGDNDFTPQEISLRRNEIVTVWRARLRFGERNIAKAAWIGAAAGLAIAVIAAGGQDASTDPPNGARAAIYHVYGAGAAAIVGAFWKKKHKKQELVYSI